MFSLFSLHCPGRDLGTIMLSSNLKDMATAKQAGKQPCIVCFHVERVLLRLPSSTTIVRGQCALARPLPFEYDGRPSASKWCTHQAPDTNSLDNKSTGWLLPVLLHTSRCIALRCIFVHLHSKIASSWPMCALVFRTSGRLWKSIFSCLVGKYK